MPGMTANITVIVQKVDSVLIVPGKALRFTPDQAFLAEYMKNNPMHRRQDSTSGGQHGNSGRQSYGRSNGEFVEGEFQAGDFAEKRPSAVWQRTDGKVLRRRVKTGAADGTNTEVKWGLQAGDTVIIAMSGGNSSGNAVPEASRSPFMPQRRGGRR